MKFINESGTRVCRPNANILFTPLFLFFLFLFPAKDAPVLPPPRRISGSRVHIFCRLLLPSSTGDCNASMPLQAFHAHPSNDSSAATPVQPEYLNLFRDSQPPLPIISELPRRLPTPEPELEPLSSLVGLLLGDNF